MVKVFIDQIECDIDDSESIALSYKSTDLTDVESGRTGSSILLKLPFTATNSQIFGAGGDVHPATKFNSQWHEMTIVSDGLTLYSGTAYLMEVVWSAAQRYFSVECRGGVLSWAETAADTLFKEIGIEYSSRLTITNIKSSWEDDSPVKFFPIVRDSYEDEGSTVDVTGVRLVRSIDDYHPFFRVSSLLEAIFAQGGYGVESQTMVRENFDELYMSGSYSSAENSAARAAMGFYVKRSDEVTTTTDYSGRVSMSPYDIAATVGNLVDLQTTLTDSECYNYGGVLQMDGQALQFVPLTQICVGFEYYLHYTCVAQIESASRLKGIDTLNTISNGNIEWELTNRHIDQRDDLVVGVSYNLIVFDHEDGAEYRIIAVDDSGNITELGYSTQRMTQIVLTGSYAYIEVQSYNGVGFLTYDDAWAIYFGYIEEYSPVEVKVTVRSAPCDYSPTSPMQFEYQLLQGGCSATQFTLHEDTSIRPFFSEYPGYNSTIEFADIAQISYSPLDFLSALQHLFNLRFATNESSKVVTIESFDEFFNGDEFDWSDKLLLDEDVEFSDFAQTTHRTVKYGYQQVDGVVQRMGQTDNKYFGEWSFEVDSYVASSSDQTLLNPIFSASTNDEDGVMVVGDRDDVTTVDSLNFSPRIARYFGLQPVEDENYSLPQVAFHLPDDLFTLCFEDRDSVEGLNRLYLSEVELLGRSQIVTLSLTLTALEYSNLFEHNDRSASQRSIFIFDIYGERFRTILYSIESYNVHSGVARCSFLTID